MVGGGIFALPLDWWIRAYLAMGVAMVVQSCFTLAKNLRDLHEASRMINRIEEARTERLLSAVKWLRTQIYLSGNPRYLSCISTPPPVALTATPFCVEETRTITPA